MNTKLLALAAFAASIFSAIHAAEKAASFDAEVSGSGQPMILIPGLACNGRVWDQTVEQYENSYECHVISLAGFGGIAPIDFENNFLGTVKDDLVAYIRNNKLENPILVGHSLGGFIALQIGIEEGDQISKIIVVDSLPFFPGGANPNATVESMKAAAESTRSYMQQNSQTKESTKMMLQMMITDPANIELAAEMGVTSDGKTVGQAMYELNTTDLRNDIAKIETPTLVLGSWIAYQQFGSTRETTQAVFNGQYAKHPNYQLELSDKGRHFIMWDDPEFFFAQLDGFLK